MNGEAILTDAQRLRLLEVRRWAYVLGVRDFPSAVMNAFDKRLYDPISQPERETLHLLQDAAGPRWLHADRAEMRQIIDGLLG